MVVLKHTLKGYIANLAARSEEPLGSHMIARQLAITPRMVRYNIDSITSWVNKRGGGT